MFILQGKNVHDILLSDGGYKQLGAFHVKPHRKPNLESLTVAQLRENDTLIEIRCKEERRFGDQTTKFDMIKKEFRHGERKFNAQFKTSNIEILFLFSNYQVCALMNIEHIAKRNPENEQEATNHPFFLLSQTMELQEMFEGIVPEEEEVPQGENLYGNTFSIAVPAVSENSPSVHSPDIETEILMELEEMDKRIEQEVEQQFSSKLPFPLYLSKKQNLMKIFLKTQIMKIMTSMKIMKNLEGDSIYLKLQLLTLQMMKIFLHHQFLPNRAQKLVKVYVYCLFFFV